MSIGSADGLSSAPIARTVIVEPAIFASRKWQSVAHDSVCASMKRSGGVFSTLPPAPGPEAEAYAAQNEQFVTGVDGDLVHWGYQGQLTDEQLRAGFLASGADAGEAERFTAAIRGRIETLRDVTQPGASGRRIL